LRKRGLARAPRWHAILAGKLAQEKLKLEDEIHSERTRNFDEEGGQWYLVASSVGEDKD
jgi:hypothetical protein